ncbi:MAG: fluoride efflux transporter CrcB [Chloroflexi bacterium]|nr:fluoride efflux transporter CrcB [Chloroflexota bacterium]
MERLFWIGLGGFLGSNARYLLSGWAAERWGSQFPYGTLIINLTGSLLLGFFLTVATERLLIPVNIRLFFATGFCGGYTTFSTFMYESLQLFEQGGQLGAVLNLASSIALGMVCVLIGVFLARLL